MRVIEEAAPAPVPAKKKEPRHQGRRVLDDAFVLYSYKIKQCTRTSQHNVKLCPWAHPGETAAARRQPHLYVAELCPDVRMGRECPHGEACSYSKNAFEMWLHPDKYRTTLCQDGPSCTRNICWFAHSRAELRRPSAAPSMAGTPPPSAGLLLPGGPQPSGLVRMVSSSSSLGLGLQAEQRTCSTGSTTSSSASSSCPAACPAASAPQPVYHSSSNTMLLVPATQQQQQQELTMLRLAALSQQHQEQQRSQSALHDKQLVALQQQQRQEAEALRQAHARETSLLLQQLQQQQQQEAGGAAWGVEPCSQAPSAQVVHALSSSESLQHMSSERLASLPSLTNGQLQLYGLGQLSVAPPCEEAPQLMLLDGTPLPAGLVAHHASLPASSGAPMVSWWV